MKDFYGNHKKNYGQNLKVILSVGQAKSSGQEEA